MWSLWSQSAFALHCNISCCDGTNAGVSPCNLWPYSATQERVLFYLVRTWRERVKKCLSSIHPAKIRASRKSFCSHSSSCFWPDRKSTFAQTPIMYCCWEGAWSILGTAIGVVLPFPAPSPGSWHRRYWRRLLEPLTSNWAGRTWDGCVWFLCKNPDL